jgi:hypothetical protein
MSQIRHQSAVQLQTMTEEEIKAKAAAATRQMMARYDTPEFKAEIAASLAADNASITHEEFVRQVGERKMGVKFNCRPSKILIPPKVYVFVALVVGYYFLPWVACPIWAWHEHNWILALGVLVSKGATRTAAGEKHPPIVSGLFLAAIGGGLWAWLGIHSYWTYFVSCAAWGMTLFAVAEEIESKFALKRLVEDKPLFERLSAAGEILIVRA